ncbi:MAG: hypothetical protein ACE5JS_22950 [Nitrospinota bacterium]
MEPRGAFTLKKILLGLAVFLLLIPTWTFPQLSRPLIPFEAVPKKEDRLRLINISNGYTLYRELSPTVIEGNQEQYDFLLDHLDLTAYVVRRLGLGKQAVRRLEPNVLEGHDGEGLAGRMSLVLREKNKRIYLARGRLKNFLFFDLWGRAIIVAEQIPQDPQKQSLRLTLYVKLDSELFDVIFHLFSPLVSGAVTERISKFLTATSIASQAIRKDPGHILEILNKADDLDEGAKSRFASLFLPRARSSRSADGHGVKIRSQAPTPGRAQK